MADEHRPSAKAQMPLSSGSVSAERHRGGREPGASARRLSARKGSLLFRGRRRTALTVMAAVFVLVGSALALSHFTAGSTTTGRVVDDSTVEYTAGHRPPVPDITGVSLTGTAIKISSYRGKVLVLNFWGSWCGPCRAEAPTLEVAYQQYHAQGVDFLGDDVGETPTNALSFTHSERISYPSINDPGYSVVQQFSQAAPVSDPPTTAVIDKTGHVVGMILGPISISELTPLLHQAASA